MEDALKKNLEKLLKEEGLNGRVTDLEYLTGGASNETWKFFFSSKTEKKHMIFRRSLGESSPMAISKRDEASIQQLAFKKGAPVAKIIAIADKNSTLGDAYIMKHIEGETIARKILRDKEYSQAKKKLAYECGEAIAKIHQVPINNFKNMQVSSPKDLIHQLYLTYEGFKQPLPVFEFAFKWLEDQDFGEPIEKLVHGDFRLGNLIISKKGLEAVIDWELAHIGNPIQDLGWICVNSWRFGHSKNIVGGFGEIDDLLSGYSSVCKNNITHKQIKTWQIFGTLRWGVICLIQTFSHLYGRTNSVEKAAIGRRVSETEIDLINLIFLGGK